MASSEPSASVDPRRYHSADYMAREQQALWPRVWLMAAHDSELRQPGDRRSLQLARDSVVLVRAQDGQVRAFHNVCLHRGMPLCPAGRSHGDSLRCGYHGWSYDLEGGLSQLPRGTRMLAGGQDGVQGRPQRRLSPVRCEAAAGFHWITLDQDAAPLADYLAPVLPELLDYELGSWSLTQDLSAELACNWKTSVDAHNEAYHVPSLHPETLAILDPAAATTRLLDRHSSLTVPFGQPADPSAPQATQALLGWARSQGVEPSRLTGAGPEQVRAAVSACVQSRLQQRGAATLDDSRRLDTWQYHLFPNVQLNLRAEELLLFRHLPHPTDPERMVFEQQSFSRKRGTAAPPSEARRLPAEGGGFGPVTDADVAVILQQQRGLRSRGLTELCLVEQEATIAHMHRVLDRYLPGPA